VTSVLTDRALNRAVLARQHLLEPSTMTAEQMISFLVAMQAQTPAAPYFGLWSRLPQFRPEQLSQLITDRRVARLALLRSTVHLVTAADALLLRPWVQPVLVRQSTPGSVRGKILADFDWDDMCAAADEFVATPRSSTDLAEFLAQRYPGIDKETLLIAVRCALPLVQVPPRGLWGMPGNPVLTTAQRWLGAELATEIDVPALVRRYLAAFGPASVKDMQAWSGLTRLSAAFAAIRDELVTFRSEAGVELFDLPDAPRPGADADVPARLLAEYDNVLLSHADRGRILPGDTKQRLFTINGHIRSAVLLDGVVAGAWKLTTTGTGPVAARLEPFRPWRRGERAAATALVHAAAAFAAPGRPVEVQVG
jgi:hypothetical protein